MQNNWKTGDALFTLFENIETKWRNRLAGLEFESAMAGSY